MLRNNKKHALFNTMKYIVLVAFVLTFAYIAIMDGVDRGEGEINTFSFIFFFIRRAPFFNNNWLERYLWLGIIISITNYILMWRFYPSDQYKEDHYNIFLKIINVLAIISVPALWEFFISLLTLDGIHIFEDLLRMTTKRLSEIIMMLLALIPALATGVMSVMGLFHKSQEKKEE